MDKWLSVEFKLVAVTDKNQKDYSRDKSGKRGSHLGHLDH